MTTPTLPRAFPFGTATQLSRALRSGQVTSVALLKAHLARVEQFNPQLNAIVVHDTERALRDARAADRALARGRLLGSLHGLPMTVKESFNLAGQPSTWGNPALAGNVMAEDALAVQRLKAAGAVVFGKTNVPLHLADFQSFNAVYGTTRNPHDLTRTPGGSSGGSAAAVAAGLTALEFGSDIGGSIRNPAAYCGVYGHKPSWGLVPKRGHQPVAAPSAEMDLSCIGPLARSAEDLALALKVTMGPDALTAAGMRLVLPAAPKTLRGLRVAVWADGALSPVDSSVRDALMATAAVLKSAGAKLDFTARPAFDAANAHDTYQGLLMALMAARRPDYAQLAQARRTLADDDHSDDAVNLRRSTLSFADNLALQARREAIRWAWHAFFERHDLLLAPITSSAAFVHDHSEPSSARTLLVNGQNRPYFEQLFWAGLATASYLPATVVPVARTAAGLPLAAQLIGPEFGDLRTIWAAGQLGRLCVAKGGGYRPPQGY